MALTSTMYALAVSLANVDRGVYESLEFRMAMHPSESAAYFVARLLAYCLEYREGIAFSRGISDPDEPPLSVRDLTGSLKVWIEIGPPMRPGCTKPARRHHGWRSTRIAIRRSCGDSGRGRRSIEPSRSSCMRSIASSLTPSPRSWIDA